MSNFSSCPPPWKSIAPSVGVFGSAVLLTVTQSALGQPSLWRRVTAPNSGRDEALLLVAERSRLLSSVAPSLRILPASGTRELTRKLNELTAQILTLALKERSPENTDSRLLYLLADAKLAMREADLVPTATLLRQAINTAPDSPLAARAWSQLAAVQGRLGKHELEQLSYGQALRTEWRATRRGTILLNRAESAMAMGNLLSAVSDYENAQQIAASLTTQALARWGLAVATDRLGDLPTALQQAKLAASYRFGTGPAQTVALDLPGTYFLPPYEVHYYRALATMGEADSAPNGGEARRLWQTAQFIWGLYIREASLDNAPWLRRAAQHRAHCKQNALTKLD